MRRRALLSLLVLVLVPAGLANAAPKQLGIFKKWSAWQLSLKQGKECFAHSVPLKAEGKYKSRGQASISVTHRPKAGVKNEVSIAAGYTYRPESEVKLLIDEKVFRLFVDGGTAFARDSGTDAAIVEALKKGQRMTVQGISSRDTYTKDSYSLSGFTAAYNAATRACRK
jgi:hypothetical protein